MKNTKYKKGFTLIELLVVISIIGLLSSVVMAGLVSARQKANATKIVAEMNQLKTAFELYRNDKGKYPNEGNGDCKNLAGNGSCSGKIIDYLRSELVSGSYIPAIPGMSIYSEYYYLTGYYVYEPLVDEDGVVFDTNYYSCGGKMLKSYAIYFQYNEMTLSFPKLSACNDSGCLDTNYYCIGQ
ncbi:MAG: prepilin-type N-terminal cleavage/methylation domain-containing protein [Candidatus Paceibacterota bacterium]|jgi:type II secretion system protein G